MSTILSNLVLEKFLYLHYYFNNLIAEELISILCHLSQQLSQQKHRFC